VPLGDSYLELIAVVDDEAAVHGPFGRWIGAGRVPRLLGWAVRTPELDAVARRLGLVARAGARTRPDGGVVQWRLAGVDEAAATPALPFFIEWARGTAPPGQVAVVHPVGPVTLSGLELTGDATALDDWLGRHRLPVAVRPGAPAVSALLLTSTGGELRLQGV
jgi:glyoxalase-like protein